MFRKLVQTPNEYALTIARIVLGVVIWAHGAQKLLGWFGGGGFSGTMGFFTQSGIPAPLAFLVIIGEFFGGLGLVFGFLGRVGAFGVACIMAGAIWMVHAPNGFFMNWTGRQAGEGFEYHLLAIGLSLAVLLRGSGALSVDRWITDRLRGSGAEVRTVPRAA